MEYYYFRCRSITYAQRASRTLERAGVHCGITKLPQRLSDDGCGYSLKISDKYYHKSYALLKNAGFDFIRIYASRNNLDYREVLL